MLLNPYRFGAPSYWNDVVVAMHMDGANGSTTITELKGLTVNRYGSAAISTAQSKFGGASLSLPTAGSDYVTVTGSEVNLPGDFTIELWTYLLSATNTTIFTHGGQFGTAAPNIFGLYVYANTLTFGTYFGGTSASSNPYVTNTWQHTAIVRNGNQVKVYVDGTAVITRTETQNFNTSIITLGQGYLITSLSGYIDDVRIIKGIARYTGDFTPPTAAFPDA